MTLTARALLATVRANPADTTARLVYADALEEVGDEMDAHLQRAIADPDNDNHRFALADALERTAGDVECEKCVDGMRWIGPGNIVECRQCSGAGRVSDGIVELEEQVRTLREAMERIAAWPTDWKLCMDGNVTAINEFAESILAATASKEKCR